MPAVLLSKPRDTSLARTEFHRLVDRTARRLYRLAARLTGSEAEGADVLQEAYLKAFDASQQVAFVTPANIDAWLYGIVTHLALNARRGLGRAKTRNEAWLQPSVDAIGRQEARLALLELNELLSVLPLEQRAALVLKEFEGLSTKEVALALAVSEGAVEQRLVRARATLKEALGHD
jgi:RNA polymerase sigma-70 factor, ECF subfamily